MSRGLPEERRVSRSQVRGSHAHAAHAHAQGAAVARKPHASGILTVALVVVLLLGVGLLAYPTVSDLWNAHVQSRAVVSYAETVDSMDAQAKSDMLSAARAYNKELATRDYRWLLSEEEQAAYESQLSVDSTGIMAYLEIPSIDVELPVYHGTSEAVLSVGAGHIEGSSLPVGGLGTHAVISGHRGLPSARLLTDLDKMSEGDLFYIRVLGETLAYEVDQILTVEPDDVAALAIDDEQDLCTLVTCTPYGINSHRLLVRGHRVEVPDEAASALDAAPQVDNAVFVATGVAAAVAIAAGIAAAVVLRKRARARKERELAARAQAALRARRRGAHAASPPVGRGTGGPRDGSPASRGDGFSPAGDAKPSGRGRHARR